MTTYWRFHADPNHDGWLIDDGGDGYIVATHAGQRQTWSRRLPKVGSPQEAIRNNWQLPATAVVQIEECKLAPGQYYPRIYLPNLPLASNFHFDREWMSSVMAVRTILSEMEEIFGIIEPSVKNSEAYGHKIRQLLILACTEVESACKAVLKANHYPTPNKDRWSTADFVKVSRPLRLPEWEVALLHHRDFPSFKPFEGWDPAKPTESLPWYKAYNAVKHDRETEFEQATIKNMITAAGAAYVTVAAQFGQFGYAGFSHRETDAFYAKTSPTRGFTECYLPPLLADGATWTPIDYPSF